MDFNHGQSNMPMGDPVTQSHKPSIWMRPFANRGYSAPSVPTSLHFTGTPKANTQPFMNQFNGDQLPKQHFLDQPFPRQHFTGQAFLEQDFQQQRFGGQHFPSQQLLNSNVYGDAMHTNNPTTLAIHNQDYQDRNETKPRLAKTEVELLERHFQENHKPPSSLKRQLAEGMNVQVARINNWFQNRRAKAKHEKKQETKRLEGESTDVDVEQIDDFDLSLGFPEAFDDEEERMRGSSGSTPFRNISFEDITVMDTQNDGQRIGTEIDRSNFDFTYLEQSEFDHSPISSSAQDNGQFMVSSTPSDDANFHFASANNQGPVDEYNAETLVAQLSTERELDFQMPPSTTPDNAFPSFPSELLSSGQQLGGFQLMSNTANNATSIVETVQEGMTMRFMSPPPATDIASRRSKRRPAPIGTDAIKDRSTSGVRTPLTAAPPRRATKSPGASIRRVSSAGALKAQGGYRVTKSSAHPSQSPLRQHFPYDLRNISGMDSQVNVIQSTNGGLAPPTPRSPNGQFYLEDNGKQFSGPFEHHAEQIAMMNGNFWNQELSQFSPPETPGHHSNAGSNWAGYDVSDNVIHTPNFGGFPADPFSLQMHQSHTTPSYVSSSGGFAPSSLSAQGSNGQGSNFELYSSSLPMPPYMTPETSNSSVSPLSSSDNLGFTKVKFENHTAEGRLPTQYQWDQQVSDFIAPSQSPSEQPRNKALVFHHATPKDFQGKPCSGQP